MEEWIRSKYITIEIGEKEYKLGYPTRRDAVKAEDEGLSLLDGKLVKLQTKLFYTAMKTFNPFLKEEDAEKLLEQYIDEGGDIEEVNTFLSDQYRNFLQPQDGKKKAKKKMKIITE